MTIKAKFQCETITDTKFSGNYIRREVSFRAVYGESGENESFSKATPTGSLKMVIDISTEAYDHFQPGEQYYLTIDKA